MSRPYAVAIIGTGFSGIGMAARLRSEHVTDFIVLEKADRLGGTWRDNDYPGAACDAYRSNHGRALRVATGFKTVSGAGPYIRFKVSVHRGLGPVGAVGNAFCAFSKERWERSVLPRLWQLP